MSIVKQRNSFLSIQQFECHLFSGWMRIYLTRKRPYANILASGGGHENQIRASDAGTGNSESKRSGRPAWKHRLYPSLAPCGYGIRVPLCVADRERRAG